jgi:hypothetical protein
MSRLDRRVFLGTLTMSGAALLSGGLALGASPTPAAVLSGTWHVDDMWGHWPPYAHPIPHTGAQPGAHPWESLDPVDRMWGSGL